MTAGGPIVLEWEMWQWLDRACLEALGMDGYEEIAVGFIRIGAIGTVPRFLARLAGATFFAFSSSLHSIPYLTSTR